MIHTTATDDARPTPGTVARTERTIGTIQSRTIGTIGPKYRGLSTGTPRACGDAMAHRDRRSVQGVQGRSAGGSAHETGFTPGKHAVTDALRWEVQRNELVPPGRSATAHDRWVLSTPQVDAETARAHGFVQFDPSASPDHADPARVHELAAAGIGGPGGALPHLEAIQRSFGHHDVSDVVSHVGGEAASAAAGMNARAYAHGDHVAFASAPDLHLAAHEAAHVVQQRGGVRLSDGVGRAGDAFERHADEVAARVVRGESAESLLDEHAHRGAAGGPAVQRYDPDSDSDGGAGGAAAEPRAGGEAGGTPWDELAAAFRGEFSGVLHVFGGPEQTTGARLRQIFSEAQRAKLMRFTEDHMIPDRLFNGGDLGHASPQQRIMVSSHILTVGRFQREEEEAQRVEARMCGHWVSLVYTYAGVTSSRAQGVRGNFDHAGNAVLGAPSAAPRREIPRPQGGVVPMSEFHRFQPGDWLYLRQSINHSVIFSSWETPPPGPGDRRRPPSVSAVTYDQRRNNQWEGGLRHERTRLSDRPGTGIWTVVRVDRVGPDARTAQTPEDVVPGVGRGDVEPRNEQYLRSRGVELARAIEQVQAANRAKIEMLARPRGRAGRGRLSAEQVELLNRTNDVAERTHAALETVVRLNERLRHLEIGAEALDDTSDRYRTAHGGICGAQQAEDTGCENVFDRGRAFETTGLVANVHPRLGSGGAPATQAGGARPRAEAATAPADRAAAAGRPAVQRQDPSAAGPTTTTSPGPARGAPAEAGGPAALIESLFTRGGERSWPRPGVLPASAAAPGAVSVAPGAGRGSGRRHRVEREPSAVVPEAARPADAEPSEAQRVAVETVRERLAAVQVPSSTGRLQVHQGGWAYRARTHAGGNEAARGHQEFMDGATAETAGARTDPQRRAWPIFQFVFKGEGDTSAINAYDSRAVTIGAGFSAADGRAGRIYNNMPAAFLRNLFDHGIQVESDNSFTLLDLERGCVERGANALRILQADERRLALLATQAQSEEEMTDDRGETRQAREWMLNAQFDEWRRGLPDAVLDWPLPVACLAAKLQHWQSGPANWRNLVRWAGAAPTDASELMRQARDAIWAHHGRPAQGSFSIAAIEQRFTRRAQQARHAPIVWEPRPEAGAAAGAAGAAPAPGDE